MKNKSVHHLAWLLTILLGCFLSPATAAADYEYIDISNPFLRKVPIAVPVFKPGGGDAKGELLATKAADLLADTLEFTGYFDLLDRGAFLFDPRTSGITAPDINFKNWTLIGAELLVTGALSLQGDTVAMDLRLFDTIGQKLLVGKRYKAALAEQRRMIRLFCSEIVYYLTGNRGFFQSQIAFVSTGTGVKELFLCDFDGYKPRQLTSNKAITLFPAWSSNGQWIAYTSYRRGKPDLYIRELRGVRGAVVNREGINANPAWVPGHFALAATLSFNGDQEIYLLTGTGKITKRLTRKPGSDVSPSWSPDGKRMAFVSSRSGSPQVYIMEADSGRVQRLTFEGNYNTQPCWSPRGDKIAYSSMVNGRHNIFVIGADGSGPYQLTASSGDNEAPTWSPDGSLIAFSSTREGPSRIYVMTAFGTDQRRLLALAGEQSDPAWSPNIAGR